MNLTCIDYVIMGVPLVFVLAVAAVMRKYMRSVADYLAASRCAGRYLVCTAMGELSASVVALVSVMEAFSQTGFSMNLWTSFSLFVMFILTLFGLVSYRFRETRCLTFHQFVEVRYSKGLRIFASFVNVFSGLFNFGLVPAVGGRFFVYFCGLPEHLALGPVMVPTYAIVMVSLMVLSLLLTLTGGQISIMVTDCIQGLISGVLFLVVVLALLALVPLPRIKAALVSGVPGNSFVNPLDIGNRPDFNGWYVVLSLAFAIYFYRGNAWLQGFSAAAKTAHEGRMAGILASWRNNVMNMLVAIVCMAAFTVLHEAHYAPEQAAVRLALQHVQPAQLQTEMAMPEALGLLLWPGIKGAFCAIGLFGLIASQGASLHSYGNTLFQDVILPMRRKVMSPSSHLLALRLSAVAVAMFVCFFSIIYTPVDYLQLMIILIGAIYLGGIGVVVWGGLYWKKGTTSGAWTAMIAGSVLAVASVVLQQFWVDLQPWLLKLISSGAWGRFLAEHPDKCPLNGQVLSALTALVATIGYVTVSLATNREDFNMERMLHRGRYAVVSEHDVARPAQKSFSLSRLLGVDEHYTRGDKIIAVGTFFWSLAWQLVAVGLLVWSFVSGRLSNDWWFNYAVITGLWIPVVLGVMTTVWFTIGATVDLVDLFRRLKVIQPNDRDDGTVVDHHNVGEPQTDLRDEPQKIQSAAV